MRKVAISLTVGVVTLLTAAATPGQSVSSPNAKIDALFAKWDKSDSPGLALAVIKDGKVAYQRGYGMSNLELRLTCQHIHCFPDCLAIQAVYCLLYLVAPAGRRLEPGQ